MDSHLGSLCSLIKLFSTTCLVLSNIINDIAISKQRAEANGVYDAVASFEFVLILHLMREIMEIIDIFVKLCNASLKI